MTPLDTDSLIALIGCIAFPLAIFGGLEFSCRHVKSVEAATARRFEPPVLADDDGSDWLMIMEAERIACRRS